MKKTKEINILSPFDILKDIPSEIEILPAKNDFEGRDGRKFKTQDRQKIISASKKNMMYMPIDENHTIDYNLFHSPAFGWMHSLYIKDDNSVWAKVDWTERGKKAIAEKEYKYISPVFEVNQEREILLVLRAALTNNPNLHLTSLNSKRAKEKNINENKKMEDEKMAETNKIASALGLDDEASVTQIVKEINTLKTKEQNMNDFVSKTEFNSLEKKKDEAVKALKEAEEKHANFLKEQNQKEANTILDKAVADGKIAPAVRGIYLDMCAKDGGLDEVKKIIEASPVMLPLGEANMAKDDKNVEVNAVELEAAKALDYTEDEYKKLKEKDKK